MKKQILILCTLLSIRQCYSMSKPSDARVALTRLYQPIKNLPIDKITDQWFKNWATIVTEITTYAVNSSKNILGKYDMDLVGTATEINAINADIIALYTFI